MESPAALAISSCSYCTENNYLGFSDTDEEAWIRSIWTKIWSFYTLVLHRHQRSWHHRKVLDPLIFARCGWCLYTSFMLVEKHFKDYNSLTNISYYCWQQAGFLHTKDLRPWLFCQRDITETLVHLLMCSIITLHFVDRFQDFICCRPSASTRCCQKHYGELLLSCCLSSD